MAEGGTRIQAFEGDELIRDAIAHGIDLRDRARDVGHDLVDAEYTYAERQAAQTMQLVQLHATVEESAALLVTMEKLLGQFVDDLGAITGEITMLQAQSAQLSVQFTNRVRIEAELRRIIRMGLVTRDAVHRICDGDINEAYVAQVNELSEQIRSIEQQTRAGMPVKAFASAKPELDRLKARAAEKIRDFLLKKVESLRAPGTNIAIIQQSVLIKYRELYAFIAERDPDVAAEVRLTYVHTVGSYYQACFERYLRFLNKMGAPAGHGHAPAGDRQDWALANLDDGGSAARKSGAAATPAATPAVTPARHFAVGDRARVLKRSLHDGAGLLIPRLTEQARQQGKLVHPEQIFASLNQLVMDNACSEYVFTTAFFTSTHKAQKAGGAGAGAVGRGGGVRKGGATQDFWLFVWNDIYDGTVKLVLAYLKQLVESTWDAITILLCIRLNAQNVRIMQRRRIPCLENYHNAVNMLLWPRFQAIMDLHLESLRKANPTALIASKATTGHVLVRRFAELTFAIHALNEEADEAMLTNGASRLRNEVESLLFKMSGEFADRRQRLMFLINNYDTITTVYRESVAATVERERAYFETVLENKMAEYVEEELKPPFAPLQRFVNEAELMDDASLQRHPAAAFDGVAQHFNAQWKAGLAGVHANVMRGFPNLACASRILHAVLVRLIMYHEKFLELWAKRFGKERRAEQPIGIQSVMVEVRRIKSSFN
ncbi:Vps52-domain-containing protein [Caulochytrium protostelioides]|uniref:Vps52-domain-containing protein n=1 Tax=Caulochytrium protostelioides TaxID=1555241 RepID=A0A4P9WR75_9FUNG|nr:Vps52-domain-containing protein [Caulochytrium protostelioides]